METSRSVFIPNRSRHDFSGAERFGTLKFLTTGIINRLEIAQICRVVEAGLEESNPNDLILPSSLTVLSAIASAVFALKHGRLNLLIYCAGDYLERNINFMDLKEAPCQPNK